MGLDMFFSKKNTVFGLLAVSFLYGLCILALGSYYTWPNLECINESRSILVGGWSAWTQLMVSMDGRYATNLLHVINPMAWGWMEGYKLMPLLGIFLFIVSAILFFGAIFNSRALVIWFCCLWATIHFAISPSLSYELYQMVASFMYLWGVAAWLLWVGAFIRSLMAKREIEKQAWFILSSVFLVYNYGVNEMFLVINTITLLAIVGLGWVNSAMVRVLPLLAVGIMATVFFFAGSGSFQRLAYETATHQSNHLRSEWGHYVAHYFHAFLLLFSNSFFVLPLFVLSVGALALKPAVEEFIDRPHNKLTIAGALFASFVLCSIPFYLFMGSNGMFSTRIFVIVFSFAQLFLIAVVVLWGQRWLQYHVNLVHISAIGAAFIVLFADNNYSNIITEWKNGSYDELQKHYEVMHNNLRHPTKTNGWRKATIQPMYDKKLINHFGATHFPVGLNWQGRVLEGYYDLDEVVVVGDTLDKEYYLNRAFCRE
jgi:hypothetical protein